MSVEINHILKFWFGSLNPAEMLSHREEWWMKNEEFDKQIEEQFSEIYEQAALQKLENWKSSPLGCVALVILLDQFPRNMFRNSFKAFATDTLARNVTHHAVQMGFDQVLPMGPRLFLYMPLEHSESRQEQKASVELISRLGDDNYTDYAIKHQLVIDKFGRFPHRNKILGRDSTDEEITFLNQPGSRF
ncbi:DUF924 family protein [Terasakiella sp. SH-1]|uniref:DUF924 family protein n=1 Tax=Terasakiella sp. SH-1 TaxID=2560057 RepID=UPI001073AFDA|nr:DUF924 family protein [Terasakiella sp. SH-1]